MNRECDGFVCRPLPDSDRWFSGTTLDCNRQIRKIEFEFGSSVRRIQIRLNPPE